MITIFYGYILYFKLLFSFFQDIPIILSLDMKQDIICMVTHGMT